MKKIFGLFIMNIVLIGYRCSGKSAVGKILAKDLGLKLVDTDQVLAERVGRTIDQYVAENGWDSFRMIEKMVVRSVSGRDNQVIATGGGVILDRENVHYLRESGWVVWLRASLSTLLERMNRDEESGRVRPALAGVSPLAEIEAVLAQRTPLYDRAGDYVVNTDEKSPRAISEKIIRSMPATSALLRKRVQSGEMLFTSVLNA